jgi:hypothetical protein
MQDIFRLQFHRKAVLAMRNFLSLKKETETAAPRKNTSETTISVSQARQNSGGHYTRTKIPCKP